MNKKQLDDLKITIAQLVEFYQGLNDLKSAGLDLIKLAPVSTIFKLVQFLLDTKYSVCITTDILEYAKQPKIGLETFYNSLCTKYTLKYDEDLDDNIHGVEFCIKDEEYQKVRDEGLKVVGHFTTDPNKNKASQKTVSQPKDEKFVKDTCDKVPEYYVNGKKVAKEAYLEAVSKLDSLFEKIFKALDE